LDADAWFIGLGVCGGEGGVRYFLCGIGVEVGIGIGMMVVYPIQILCMISEEMRFPLTYRAERSMASGFLRITPSFWIRDRMVCEVITAFHDCEK
jgi:hypothetical protein